MKKLQNILILLPFMIWLAFLIVIPLLLIIYYGLIVQNGDGNISFSLYNFTRLADPIYIKILLRSLWLSAVSTVMCLIIGYPMAIILSGDLFKRKTVLMILLIAPMWMNFLLRTYAWLTLLENTGLINQLLQSLGLPTQTFLYNEGAVILGMVYNLLPYMIFPIYTVISKIPKNILEAARDLGASDFVCFYKIILPLSVPGILSGVTMVFVPGVTTFVISKLLGGGKVPLIGDIIEQQFRATGDWGFGSAISIIVMIVILLCMWAVNKWSNNDVEVNMP